MLVDAMEFEDIVICGGKCREIVEFGNFEIFGHLL